MTNRKYLHINPKFRYVFQYISFLFLFIFSHFPASGSEFVHVYVNTLSHIGSAISNLMIRTTDSCSVILKTFIYQSP